MVLLGFGSSARRGATGWTDRARVRAVLDTLRPDATVDGASPAGGADDIVHGEAVASGIRALSCHVDRDLDGPWPAAGHRRNARMYRTHRPSFAAGFISGRVGEPLSSGSAGMLRICLNGLHGSDRRVVLARSCPVVVFREDGVEPHESPAVALAQFRRLYAVTQDERLLGPGHALKGLVTMGAGSREEVLAALAFAAEGSRWAPWIEAVTATVRMG